MMQRSVEQSPFVHVMPERYHEDPWLEDNMAMLKNTSPSIFSSLAALFPPLARVLPLPLSDVCCAAGDLSLIRI